MDEHNLQQSMSRRGNCHDNAVAESFFQLLKRERIRRKACSTREEAKQDVFDYIKMFYHPKRRHSFSNDFSPVEYESSITSGLRVSKKLVAIRACQIFCVKRGHEIIPKGKFHDRRNDHKKTQKAEGSIPVSG